MKIRLLKKSDIKQAAEIVGKNYSKKWDKVAARELGEMFGKSVVKPNYVVAEENGKIVGFAGYMQSWMDYNVYLIFWVNVHPERQKEGIGRKLVTVAIDRIKSNKKAELVLLTATHRNAKYYREKFGFKVLQSFGEEDNLMSLKIGAK